MTGRWWTTTLTTVAVFGLAPAGLAAALLWIAGWL